LDVSPEGEMLGTLDMVEAAEVVERRGLRLACEHTVSWEELQPDAVDDALGAG
jgi:hypothetical protein